MIDLHFISGTFFEYDVPKDRRYLLKYFKTDLQLAFLRYYLVFGDCKNFTDHTGYVCNRRLRDKLMNRFHGLIRAYETAKRSLTEEGMDVLHLIETGKFRLTKLESS